MIYYDHLINKNDGAVRRHKRKELPTVKTWREMAREIAGGELKQELRFTFIAGLLAHGFMLFNKISWRGDLNHGLFLNQDKAISLGRWFKSVLCFLVAKAFGGKNWSMPLLFGIITILLIALSAHIIIRLFDIRRRSLRMSLCALMVVFPVVACTLGFMFDAPYYFFAMLLAITGIYIAARHPRWDGFVVGMLCVGACLSIYQAYFPVAVSLAVILLIFEIANDRFETLGKAILRGVYFLGLLCGALALFFVTWKIALKVTGLTANEYQGASSIGESGLMHYLKAVLRAYYRFLVHTEGDGQNLYPMVLVWVQRLLIAASGFSALYIAVRHFKKNRLLALMMLVLMALLPLCFNLVYVLAAASPSESVYVYSLMLYGQCMLYVALVCALDFMLKLEDKRLETFSRWVVAAMAVMVCLNIYLDNACYLKAEFVSRQAITQTTVLIARIKSVEGYDDTLPVCLVKGEERDDTDSSNTAYEDIVLAPFDRVEPYHNKNELRMYMKEWCGFRPEWAASEDFRNREDVLAMPEYPADGSIQIIDNTVVVKW